MDSHRLRLDSLHLRNFRSFEDFGIDFHGRLTVIVGGNGYGKTAALDAIAVALGPFVGGFDDGRDCYFQREDIRRIRVKGSNRMELADGGIGLRATGIVDSEPVSWNREFSGPKSRTTRKGAQRLSEFAKRLQSQVRREADVGVHGACLPVVAYYGTDRLWNIRRMPHKPLPRTSRMVGYTHSLESGSDFHLMAEWLRYWSYAALEHRHKAQGKDEARLPSEADNALEAVRKAINVCLSPSGWGDIDFSIESQEIVARHPQMGELPVAMLSDGIRNMLTLVADIAFRAVKLNPNLGPYAAIEAEGIVLIDEVDMHLHPAWQQTVLASLREAFPRIQFIVTTHSPQVLSTVHRDNIRVLAQDTIGMMSAVQPLAKTYGELSGDVLEAVMHVDPQAPIPERDDLRRLTELVDQGDFRGAEAMILRQKLKGSLGEQHPQLQRIERSIQRQALLKP